MTILWFASSESYRVRETILEALHHVWSRSYVCNVAFPYREQRRREKEKERAPTYLLNIHIQPTYAEYFTHTRRRYALRVIWKVIHVKQKAKHCVIAGGTRVEEF